jgi:hypothetical protein
MNTTDIIRFRLSNQQIADTKFKRPEEILGWFGAMQAQEFAGAKWAFGLRLKDENEGSIDTLFNEGKILRTHLLRPTWHFVLPQDIRWMLALTAPRVHAVNKYYYKKFELDSSLLQRANKVLVTMLRDGKTLTRATLNKALGRGKIKAEGLRLGYIFMQAELEGIICSGPREGKQFTYALLDERVRPSKPMHPEESLAELSKRYFASRGPATMQDFVWWSGLTAAQAKEGVALLDKTFIRERLGDQEYILNPPSSREERKVQTTFLMPDYDEYGISYKDRSALFKNIHESKIDVSTVSSYSHMLIVDGVISGTWKMTNSKSIEIEISPLFEMPKKLRAIDNAIERYKSFLKPIK